MTGVRLGLLHTVASLAARFDALAGELAPDSRLLHLVDPDLLATAISGGVTDELRDRVAEHVGYLTGRGVAAVLVTCSSIGELADAAAGTVEVPVLRVDRPMAQEAVAIATGGAGRIAVLAKLTSTLGPTQRLVAAEAGAAPVAIDATLVVDGVAAAVEAAAGTADVIVLAQASMADAAGSPGTTPVLSSPVSGLRAALAAARRLR